MTLSKNLHATHSTPIIEGYYFDGYTLQFEVENIDALEVLAIFFEVEKYKNISFYATLDEKQYG